jgi:hypothetical protein
VFLWWSLRLGATWFFKRRFLALLYWILAFHIIPRIRYLVFSHLTEKGSLDYDRGFVCLKIQTNFDMTINHQRGPMKDRLGDQKGGSEWEPIKILLKWENTAYIPNSQPRIPTWVCQGHVVTMYLLTLGTNPQTVPKWKHESRSNGLSNPAQYQADCSRAPGGLSVSPRRTVREVAADCPKKTHKPLVLHQQ